MYLSFLDIYKFSLYCRQIKKPPSQKGDGRLFRGTTRNSPDSALSARNGATRQTLLLIQAAAPRGKPKKPTANGSQHPVLSAADSDFSDNLIIAFYISLNILSQFEKTCKWNRLIN